MADFESLLHFIGVEPHPDADRLELATVGDYKCVVAKGAFRDGELAAYIPEASIVPDDVIAELGLEGRLSGGDKNRVKAVKLRGVVSQGLVYPVTGKRLQAWIDDGFDLSAGDDVTEVLGLEKYEPPIPAKMQGKWKAASPTGPYMGRLVRYDIENVKKHSRVFEDGEPVVMTEKLHGTSKGLAKRGVVLDLDDNKGNLYVDAFHALRSDLWRMVDMLCGSPSDEPVHVFGEIYGSGVQDLAYGTKRPEFRVFDIRVGTPMEGFWLPRHALEALVDNTDAVQAVPVVYRGPFSKDVLAEHTNGKTTLGGSHIREGVVVEPVVPRGHPNLGRVILKSVSDAYLLRKGGTELA